MADLLIAAIPAERDSPAWSLDRDFGRLALEQPRSHEISVIVEDAPGCPADLVVDDPTVSGVHDYAGVNSVTLGPGTEFDATSNVSVEAGNFVKFENSVTVLGEMAIRITPTPCP